MAHRHGGPRPLLLGWAILVVCAGMLLPGCTPAPDGPTPDPVETPAPTPSDEAPPVPYAVLSIAAVDVDGLNVTVAGYLSVPDESGGSCRYELTSEATGVVVEATTTGEANGPTTVCPATEVSVDRLSRGSWLVSLHYTSEQFDTVSEPIVVEVP